MQFWPEDERREEGLGRNVPQRVCPVCRARNDKVLNNNHMTCWSCATPFCGACQAVLRNVGNRHFLGAGKCRQHTRD